MCRLSADKTGVGIVSVALGRSGTYTGHVREAASTVRATVLYPLGIAERLLSTGDSSGDVGRDIPVLLVHGYGHNRSGWFNLDRGLRRAGFTSVHTMNYVPVTGVPELAAKLAGRVAEIRAHTGADKVHVVGHSLGGILMRWYVQELGGHAFVDTAITVASPHEGTIAALLGPGRCARDLRPGSRVMRRLAAGARPSDVRWIAFYSNLDLVVQPATSAMLRPPALDATNILVKDHGHVSIMTSLTVARSIVDQLEAVAEGRGTLVPMVRTATPAAAPGATPAVAAAGLDA